MPSLITMMNVGALGAGIFALLGWGVFLIKTRREPRRQSVRLLNVGILMNLTGWLVGEIGRTSGAPHEVALAMNAVDALLALGACACLLVSIRRSARERRVSSANR
jgi:hypothetical protein